MSSRFFRAASDSESESESEEELMSDSGDEAQDAGARRGKDSDDSDEDSDEGNDDDDDDAEENKAAGVANKASRFLKGADSDSDSEDEVRKVIKSAKDKRADEIEGMAKKIDEAQRINDWIATSKEYDGLLRAVDRLRNVNEPIPPAFIKCIAGLEKAIADAAAKEKSATKKMKAPNAKAMNGMKQKVKKAVVDQSDAVQKYNEDPEAFLAEAAAASAAAVPPPAPKKKKVTLEDVENAAKAAGEGEGDEDFQTVGRGGRAMNFTSEGLFKHLAAVMEMRGRKSTDRSEQVLILTKLLGVAESTYQKVRVLLALIAARFDYNATASSYMPIEAWKAARSEVDRLLETLAGDQSYIVSEETPDYDDQVDRLPNQEGEGPVIAVRGSVTSFLDRLDDEFTRSLQNIDSHTTDYIDRLMDEKTLYQTIVRAQVYFESVNQTDSLSRIIMRRLEHVYAKQDVIVHALEAKRIEAQPMLVSQLVPSNEEILQPKGPTALVRALAVHLYRVPGLAAERLRTRAMLCHTYHHALHRDYHIARDMFLMSHLQDNISLADAATQILYNRVVVQIGMCAFRLGLVRESQSALQEIFASGRVKELLAQGVQRSNQYTTLTPEQEKLDRQRQLPFHLHINLELLECIYLTSSMLLEVPNMAFAGSDPELRKRVISRPFRRMLDYTDRQVFSGPPESTRDHIMQASKSLQNGDWQGSTKLICEIKIWNLLPGADEVKTMLARRIQEEGLRTYLFSYASYYNTVSLSHLSSTFDLPARSVRGIVSKMIWTEELAASLDPINGVLVLHRLELSKVQQLAQTLAERSETMLLQNERLLDSKLGDKDRPGGERGDRERGDGSGGRREGRRGGGGGRGRGRGRGRANFNALPGQAVV